MNRITFRSAYANKSVTYGDQISAVHQRRLAAQSPRDIELGRPLRSPASLGARAVEPAMSANDDLIGILQGRQLREAGRLRALSEHRAAPGRRLGSRRQGSQRRQGQLFAVHGTVDRHRRVQPERRQDRSTFNFRDLDGNRDYTPGIGEVSLAQYDPGCVAARPTTCPNMVTEPSTSNLPAQSRRKSDGVKAPVEQEIAFVVRAGSRAQHGRAVPVRQQERFSSQTNITPGRPYEVWNRQITRRDPGQDGLLSTADDPLVNGRRGW